MPVIPEQLIPPSACQAGIALSKARLPLARHLNKEQQRWYVLKVIPNRERRVASTLRQLALSYYLPYAPRTTHGRHTVFDGVAPLFPGHLFLMATPSELAHRILYSPDLRGHLQAGGARNGCIIEVGNAALPPRRQAAQRHLQKELQAIRNTLADQQKRRRSLHAAAPRVLTQTETLELRLLEETNLGGRLEGTRVVVLHPPTITPETTSRTKVTLTIRILGQAVDLTTTPERLLA